MSILAPRNVYRYIKYVIGEQGQVLNRLLVRDQVGHPRPATYKLPPPDKAYGVKYPSDAFGTRDGACRAPSTGSRGFKLALHALCPHVSQLSRSGTHRKCASREPSPPGQTCPTACLAWCSLALTRR